MVCRNTFSNEAAAAWLSHDIGGGIAGLAIHVPRRATHLFYYSFGLGLGVTANSAEALPATLPPIFFAVPLMRFSSMVILCSCSRG